MEIDPPDMAQVPLDTFARNAATPSAPDASFRGLIVRVPTEVRIDAGEEPVIPIAGFGLLDVPSPPTDEPMLLIAVDEAGDEHQGVIAPVDEGPVIPPPALPPPDPADLVGVFVESYFNPDLVATCSLAPPFGRYRVRVEYRGFVSNEEEVAVVDIVP
ncbi:MAG: hypothetical protein H6719_09915 [Sandaracinaceae bacterium]|nr:hypothetical protein [Sandaracinaceae bacterium]